MPNAEHAMSLVPPTVTVDDLPAVVGDGILLLDVREDVEWMAGHAPGARHLPMYDLPATHGSLPTGVRIVCICRSGNRSNQATRYLLSLGFDAVDLTGGMNAWAAAGRPVVTPDGRDGMVI